MSKLKKGESLIRNGEVSGKWVLTMAIENVLGAEGFGFYQLGSYPDPFTQRPRVVLDPNGNVKNGVTITAIKTIYNTENINQKNDLLFLLGHPEVKVEGIDLKKEVNSIKKSNPKFTLINVDAKNMTDIEDENTIDKVVGKLSVDTGPQSISLKKMRFILAALNLSYFERRYVNNEKTEKKYLRSALKRFTKSGLDNAKKVDEVIKDIDYAEYIYYVKELIRFEVINYSNGSYKFNGDVIGIDMETVVAKLKSTPELYEQLKTKVEELLNE